MKIIEELYPSVFKMIRAKAKLVSKVRFEKQVHVSITRKIKNELEKLFKICEGRTKISSDLFPLLEEKKRTKIFFKDKKGKNHADIINMIKEDRAIIPWNKIKKITKCFSSFYAGKVPISTKVYPIVQTFIENRIYEYTLALLKILGDKKKKIVKTIYVHEI